MGPYMENSMKWQQLIAATLTFLVVPLAILAQNDAHNPRPRKPSPFRYVIVADVTDLQKYINEGSCSRDVVVVMEGKAFNEKNLTELFRLLSKRFDDRPALYVSVTTSMDTVRTPEEYDQIDLGGGLNEKRGDFPYSFYSRNGYGEQFWYSIPKKINRKVVVLKSASAEWPPKSSN